MLEVYKQARAHQMGDKTEPVAIDGFATLVTGDAEYFWTKSHSAGGD